MKEWDRYASEAETYVKTYLLPRLTTEAKTKDSTAFWLDYAKLCTIGWSFIAGVKNETRLQAMTDYVKQSNQLTETANATGVCACLLYQMGRKQQAVQLQEKSLLLAGQTDASETDVHKDRLKRMQKGKAL
ncbi:hypothetical protein [Fibrivirga algicola]|uniref:Tetratricopeptide repeat protein n=1 Tax=Fibrivirga algicola TaxID=2950420 RepID=A0ABX0QAT5_9BACT|nr:hypothetical protein [Fibrivirga algicola]NID09106.1 hypothetical protein [Fibrivirga algicola]